LLQVEVYHKALQKAQSRLGGLFKKRLARAQSGAPSSPMSNQATAVLLDDMLTYSQVCSGGSGAHGTCRSMEKNELMLKMMKLDDGAH
jgi:hypothetical protein